MVRDVRIVAEGFSLLEGPRWKYGRLYASDFYTRRVLAFDADGSHDTVVEVEGQPSGLGWDREGRLLISSMLDRKLLRLDAGRLVEVADLTGWSEEALNDILVDTQGRAYVGNYGDLSALGRTNLIRVDPDGTITKTGGAVSFPNGACITPDGSTFLLAETFLGRISAFDIAADGDLHNKRVWAAFADGGEASDMVAAANSLPLVPDGMCLDAEGCLWVGCATTKGVYRVREGGEIVEKIDTGEQTVIAPMLGGDDGRTLFMCCAAPILAKDHATVHEATLRACEVEVPRAGLP